MLFTPADAVNTNLEGCNSLHKSPLKHRRLASLLWADKTTRVAALSGHGRKTAGEIPSVADESYRTTSSADPQVSEFPAACRSFAFLLSSTGRGLLRPGYYPLGEFCFDFERSQAIVCPGLQVGLQVVDSSVYESLGTYRHVV